MCGFKNYGHKDLWINLYYLPHLLPAFKEKSEQEARHSFNTNTATPSIEWEATKQRAPEPPLLRLSQPGKGQHEDLVLSPPEHCH